MTVKLRVELAPGARSVSKLGTDQEITAAFEHDEVEEETEAAGLFEAISDRGLALSDIVATTSAAAATTTQTHLLRCVLLMRLTLAPPPRMSTKTALTPYDSCFEPDETFSRRHLNVKQIVVLIPGYYRAHGM